MQTKTYTLEIKRKNQPPVTLTYGYNVSFKAWKFQLPNNHIQIVRCRGQEEGHRIAKIIGGAIKRCGSMDNLARSNIDSTINSR